MNRTTLSALLAAALLAASCATTVSVPDRLEKFVDKTEMEYKTYTAQDWEKSKVEYDALIAEMKENYDSYSTSQKVQVAKAAARYSSYILGSELSEATEGLGGLLEQIPETINGFIDQIDTAAIRQGVENFKSIFDTAAIRKSVEGIFSGIDTARLRKQVEGLTESIDTARLRQKLEAVIKIFGGE